MHKLILATNNRHKLEEVAQMTGNKIDLLTLADIGFTGDIDETGSTFTENALIKSRFIYDRYNVNCFADDSGLEIYALNGEPGVYSARYSGVHGDHDANMDKVLKNLQGVHNRSARFRTVISLIWDGKEYFFEGTVEGTIRQERAGNGGFGYDPIFEPLGHTVTFAQMSLEEKNAISHRARALDGLVKFLETIDKTGGR